MKEPTDQEILERPKIVKALQGGIVKKIHRARDKAGNLILINIEAIFRK